MIAEFEHIWPFDGIRHLGCVRCGVAYGPDAGMCVVYIDEDREL